MHCPRCGHQIKPHERDCTAFDPDAPDFFALWKMYFRGERTPMVWLTVVATCALVVIIILAIMAS